MQCGLYREAQRRVSDCILRRYDANAVRFKAYSFAKRKDSITFKFLEGS